MPPDPPVTRTVDRVVRGEGALGVLCGTGNLGMVIDRAIILNRSPRRQGMRARAMLRVLRASEGYVTVRFRIST